MSRWPDRWPGRRQEPWDAKRFVAVALSIVGCVWVMKATEHPGAPRDGDFLRQLPYFAMAIALAVGLTELLAYVVGRLGDGLLGRVWPRAALGLVAGVMLSTGVWHAFYRATRPLEGYEWRVLTSGGPFPVAARVSFGAARSGCASLGPGFKLATRIELETRAAELRRHGRSARFWVRESASPDSSPSSFDPGRPADPATAATPSETHLALCVQEASATAR